MPAIIQTDPKILGGQPIIAGTRIPAARIIALHAQGYKLTDFKRDYPYLKLSKKDLFDIFSYFARRLAQN